METTRLLFLPRRARRERLGSFCLYSFSHNLHLDLRSDFAMQLDGYVEVAHALERLRQLDLAAIDLEAVRREPGGNVGRR